MGRKGEELGDEVNGDDEDEVEEPIFFDFEEQLDEEDSSPFVTFTEEADEFFPSAIEHEEQEDRPTRTTTTTTPDEAPVIIRAKSGIEAVKKPSKSVVTLKNYNNGADVVLIGTAHVSIRAAEEVKAVSSKGDNLPFHSNILN